MLDICEQIKSTLNNLNFTNIKSTDTVNVKKAMCHLAKDKYAVWTLKAEECEMENTETHMSGHEWLYDLIWYKYKEGKHYALTEIILAMESEWGGKRKGADDENDPYGEVKYDFQKLLVCNSPLKLMVFKTHGNNIDTNKLLEYFQERINESVNTRPNEIFIIAYYYYDRKIREYMCKTNQFSKDGTNI